MTTRHPPDTETVYQIKVKGRLDEHWSEWFDDLTVSYDDQDDTLLTGPVIDQAALHGLLKKVGDLGLRLISVNPAESNVVDPKEAETGGHSAVSPLKPMKET